MLKMEKNIAVIFDGDITVSEHELPSPKGRNKTTKSVTCVFINKHNTAPPFMIN